MENLVLALKISGVGILALLVVLALFAGLISLLTRFLKDKTEAEESEREEGTETEAEAQSPEQLDIAQVAAIAAAIARAQSAFTSIPQSSGSELSSWGQFHLNRRLTSSEKARRTK